MSAGVFVGVLGWVIAGLLAAFLAHARRKPPHQQGVPGAERVCVLGAAAAGVLRDRRRGAVCRCGAVVFDKLTNYCGKLRSSAGLELAHNSTARLL